MGFFHDSFIFFNGKNDTAPNHEMNLKVTQVVLHVLIKAFYLTKT